MDANRKTIDTVIGGKPVKMYKPTGDQLVGLIMWADSGIADAAKIKALTRMFLSLLPDQNDQSLFMEQMMMGEYTAQQMVNTLIRLGTVGENTEAAPAVVPKKRTAKKTTARR